MNRRAIDQRGLAVFALLMMLVGLAGCPPRPPVDPEPPIRPQRHRSQDEIVRTIRDNERKLDQALWSSNVKVVARFTDEKGTSHPYNLEGSLLFQRPRNLLINLRPGIGDNVMQVGSNDREYWAWIEPELARMWWGRHENTGKACSQDVLINPSELVAAMGIGLPGPNSGLIGPILKSGNNSDLLDYARNTSSGAIRLVQEYRVMREPPFLVEVVIFFDARGTKMMTAHLTDYKPAWDGGPLLAHKISIDWPKDGNKLNMAVGTFKPVDSDKLRASAFARPVESPPLPAGVSRNVIQVDANCDPGFGIEPTNWNRNDVDWSDQTDQRNFAATPAESTKETVVESDESSLDQSVDGPIDSPSSDDARSNYDGPSSFETGDFDWSNDESDPLPEGP